MYFAREDWTLFRNLTTLCQKAGVHQELLTALCLKELVDNALDAGASVSLREGLCVGPTGKNLRGYIIQDDGPGIPGDNDDLAALFSIRRPLTSSKLLRLPTRGALGNGLRVVAGAVLASGGILTIRTRGRRLQLTPQDDGSTAWSNEETWRDRGTIIEVAFGPAMRCDSASMSMARLAIKMRGESWYTGKTHPFWYESDSFYELLQAAGSTQVRDIVGYFKGGEKAEEGGTCEAEAASLTRNEAEQLLIELRSQVTAAKPAVLGLVGEKTFSSHGYAKKTAISNRRPARGSISSEIPAVIEVWCSKLDVGSTPTATVFVNRTPITATITTGCDSGRKGRQYISGCGLNHWFDTGKNPFDIKVCVTSPYMPITNDGKAPDLRPLFSEINAAIESAARKAKRATSDGRAMSKTAMLWEVYELAIKAASSNGAHRYSLRQLYYATRPLLQRYYGVSDLLYGTFGAIIGEIENALGRDLPGMYRDARGILYHPHTGERIELGTLAVEKYSRPKWRFRNVLYIEKGGFFPLLIDERWPERWDCALLTSQGQASRAAKDVIDLLGDTDEPLNFFCLHDADGYGTVIEEALREATKARPARKVQVINLGLDPWEAEKMGLLAEDLAKTKGEVPVAEYVEDYDEEHGTSWKSWLQEKRYELNAMTSAQLLTYLDKKMEALSSGRKVVPPVQVLEAQLRQQIRDEVRRKRIAELVATFEVDAEADLAAESAEIPEGLKDLVNAGLSARQDVAWEQPLRDMARRMA